MRSNNSAVVILRRFIFTGTLLGAISLGAEAMTSCFSGKESIDDNFYACEFHNDCDYRQKFNVDYCTPSDVSYDNSPPDCEVRTLIMESHTALNFRNYA